MNIRVTIIEAHDVTSADLHDLLPLLIGAKPAAPALPAAPAAPALPPAPPKLEPPVSALPDPSIRQMAAMPSGYRPKAPRAPRATGAATKAEARPVAARKVSCRGCGFDAPDGTDGRSRCPKCGGRWETVPERIDLMRAGAANEGDDE